MNESSRGVPVAVIGVGHLGARHARHLRESSGFDLISVFDPQVSRAREVAEENGCRAASSFDEAVADARAVVVATSTPAHFSTARAALGAGKHVLVEKPITEKLADAEALAAAASEAGLVLHVGHVERFNPALRRLLGKLPRPLFVESHRLAPLVPRNLDIDVIQDLMVHDLDLALAFVGEAPVSVDAVGVPVMTGRVDIANARLKFPGGTVANLTASRVSLERVRKFRMFLPGAYVSADCAAGTGNVYRLRPGKDAALAEALRSGKAVDMSQYLDRHEEGREGGDAIAAEHQEFLNAIRGEPSEGVTGEEALSSLRVLVEVKREIEKGLGARFSKGS